MNQKAIRVRLVLLVAFAATFIFGAQIAQAQTAPSSVVGVTNGSQATTTVSAGTGVTVGSFTLGAPQGGSATLQSIPLTLTLGGGASASNLSNCQVYNQNGQALMTGSNIVNTLQSGSNTFRFDTPLSLQSGSAAGTYTVRCNVSGTSSGATVQFAAGAPTFAPSAMITLATTPVISAGTNDTQIAAITIDASRSGEGVQFTSIPLTLSSSGNLQLTSCTLRNTTGGGTSSIATPSIVNGSNTISLSSPLTVPAGSTATLALICNVPSTATPGTINVSVSPTSFTGTSAVSNTSVTGSQGLTSTGASGGLTSGLVVLTNLPNTSGPTTGTGSGTGTGTGTGTGSGTGTVTPAPGVPNTGAGGESAVNFAILLTAAIGVIIGYRFLYRPSR